MKFFEIANDLESRPIVYIDMDGVLADMWGEVARHHGVDHWRKARKKQKIDKIAKKPGFFLHLKPLPNAGRLIHNVLKMADSYSILSSPLLSTVEQSTREKAEWLENNLKKNPPRSVLFDHEKFKFARQADGTPNILIDDLDTNIWLWEANGGIGILYKDADCNKALKQLQGALQGEFKCTYNVPLAVLQKENTQTADEGVDFNKHLWTNKEVLQYVQGIHDDYHLDTPILDHKIWELTSVPVKTLSTTEHNDQDDPYRRVIDLDWKHISKITRNNIQNNPIVIDSNRWILDGNHRVTAARAAGIKSVPAFIPKVQK